ncbi:MAG: hypothetical protein OHK0012_03320 [Synechococcales cyanobacterium]
MNVSWRNPIFALCIGVLVLVTASYGVLAQQVARPIPVRGIPSSPALDIQSAAVRYLPDLDMLVFEQHLKGMAGSVQPTPMGQLDGAAVLGYVFPTTLPPEDVGFNSSDGILALAVTSHPDFDDTPLWDENSDRDYGNDGQIWHAHWVVLHPDDRVAGGLSVLEFRDGDPDVVLPSTHPPMPMYIDSPGFSIIERNNTVQVLVPAQRVNHVTDFSFDAVTAYMQVNTSDPSRPMLGVYKVYSVSSGDLSLPYSVQIHSQKDE